MVNFNCPKNEIALIKAIATRYNTSRVQNGHRPIDNISLMMDITACHCNGCPLKLAYMHKADIFNLAHDIVGISKNLNRKTGNLKNGFLPKFYVGAGMQKKDKIERSII